MTMRVTKSGEVHISAPIGTSSAAINRFITKNREWIDKAIEKMESNQSTRRQFFSQLPLETPIMRKDAAERLNSIVMPLVLRYSTVMGVSYSGISYRATISKWGSCDTKSRRLCFSLYLLLLPHWCIEHVVVHELAHLIVPNHSKQFYGVMDRYFPKWREARKETRAISKMER
jgi:predicted metal-dependent hydrolase